MERLWSVLFWSVIAAAFIGPGTVTTAASAGAGFGYSLLWALAFSTFACLALQEAAARLTVASGRDLGQAIGEAHGRPVMLLVVAAIAFGCAAYEAGNILGGAAGAVLGAGLDPRVVTVIMGLAAFALLWFGRTRRVAQVLGSLVALMGLAFLITAWRLEPSPVEMLQGTLLPRFPRGSNLLVLGLVGTTVVPYNLFMGSGLARGSSLGQMRFGLGVSVVLGGLISMGILVVGVAVDGPFGFDTLTEVLTLRLGPWSRSIFGAGLFAAGLTSAITAPFAAALTARSVFSAADGDGWSDRSWRFRGVWGAVLLVGLVFGVAGVKPIPAILLAQAANGVLLPFVAVCLLLAVNDSRLMGPRHVNGPASNAALFAVVAVTILLGLSGLGRAVDGAIGSSITGSTWFAIVSLLVTGASGWALLHHVRHGRTE